MSAPGKKRTSVFKKLKTMTSRIAFAIRGSYAILVKQMLYKGGS